MVKILIIEDDQIVANIYRNKLAVEGYKVEVALDGEAGLKLLSEFKPHLVLLDLMLPKVPGLDILRHIRASAEFKDIPVVIFSNTYLGSTVQAAWKAGATKCIIKANCTPRQLLEAIRSTSIPQQQQEEVPSCPAPPSTQPVAPPRAVTQHPAPEPDEVLQEQLRKRFAKSLPSILAEIRPLLQSAMKADSLALRASFMVQMHRHVRHLANGAGVAGFSRVAQMAAAVEALAIQLGEKPENINASCLRTIASALDFLAVLLAPGEIEEKEMTSCGNILVVDDEPISRRAVVFALEKAQLSSVAVADSRVALDLILENKFDLIFLDIDMPGMSGLELCANIRKIPSHAETPVVFVTRLNDFDNRANSTISGGTDLIGKPFLFMELAVKALCHVLRRRLEGAKSGSNNRKSSITALLQP